MLSSISIRTNISSFSGVSLVSLAKRKVKPVLAGVFMFNLPLMVSPVFFTYLASLVSCVIAVIPLAKAIFVPFLVTVVITLPVPVTSIVSSLFAFMLVMS
nr:MAG: hypothetical protein [Bacteriophage sp.]